ncbi:hypothetical protein H4582DRAFT_2076809 [Lactarius indigo]|nr:hypothetical protein H4582DRAFT_2076809 [Lactarius indigo]
MSHQNILPAPVVGSIFVAPDSVEFLNRFGPNFTHFFAAKKFNWKQLAGAKVFTIGGLPVSEYTILLSGGDLAGPVFLAQTSLKFSPIPVDSKTPELVDFPFVASFLGAPFTNGRSYGGGAQNRVRRGRAAMKGIAAQPNMAVGLPHRPLPTLSPTKGSTGVIKSYIFPGKKTGIMFVSSFLPDVDTAVKQFSASGVTNLFIDVTNNGGSHIFLTECWRV